MGHPNPRFLAIARRANPPAADAPRKKRGMGTGWKVVALAAGAGILFWTLSSPKSEGGGEDEDDRGEPRGPARALPPSDGQAATAASSPDAGDAGVPTHASVATSQAGPGGGR